MECYSAIKMDEILPFEAMWMNLEGITRARQIKNTGKDVEKREPLYTFCGNVNWCSHCGKQYGSFLKK